MQERDVRRFYVQEGVNRRHRELWGSYMYKRGYLEGVQAFAGHETEELERAKLDRDIALHRVEGLEDTGMQVDEDGEPHIT